MSNYLKVCESMEYIKVMKDRKVCLMKIFKWRYFLLAVLLAPMFVMAAVSPSSGEMTSLEKANLQTGRISGTVVDAAGMPLPGASIVITGTNIGTVTDVNGRFLLNNVPANAILEISSMGYVTQSVLARDNMNISLEEKAEALEEVVVIGYGSVRRSDLTGSVSTVTPRSFLDQASSGGLSVLAGRVPGVVVRRGNGAPGEGSTIRIRGINSIRGNNDPLIVVDGNYSGMPNMYDIESIEILKDASATAIYGSRGANGVIIVTTRRGSTEGKNEVRLVSDVSFNHIPKGWRYDMMKAAEYAEDVNAFNISGGMAALFSPADIDRIRSEGPGTDWQSEMFQLGISHNHKVIFSGGNNKMKYYVSPSYGRTEGSMINSHAESYGLNPKFDA